MPSPESSVSSEFVHVLEVNAFVENLLPLN